MRVLVSCPPMLGVIAEYRDVFERNGIELLTPEVSQTLSEAELLQIVPQVDGWIIGDDPATAAVFRAGRAGRLKAAVKWGVGVDNVDLDGAQDCGIPVTNTPRMFGNEVADLAMLYVLGLARDAFTVDRRVRAGSWPKPRGVSLSGKTVAIVGFGDIGRQFSRRVVAFGMKFMVYDPYASEPLLASSTWLRWPDELDAAHFIVFTCALTRENLRMLDARALAQVRPGVRIVNVARGGLIDEGALADALETGHVAAAALDVFEQEPLPPNSRLRRYSQCIFGSHNASNTVEAVERASREAIALLLEELGITR